MYSLLMLALALAGVAIAARALLAWRRAPSNLLLFNIIALAGIALNTALAGIGGRIGVGDQLRDLHALPVLIGIFALPFSLFTLATLSRRIGFAWARIDWGHGSLCIVAVALMVWSLPQILTLRALQPACWRDLLWYQFAVPVGLQCADHAAAIPEPAPPWALLLVLGAYAGLGLGLRQRNPGFAGAMAVAVALLMLPVAWGPLPWFAGQVLGFSAIASIAAQYATQLHQRPPEAG
jgi:hypothetical protein